MGFIRCFNESHTRRQALYEEQAKLAERLYVRAAGGEGKELSDNSKAWKLAAALPAAMIADGGVLRDLNGEDAGYRSAQVCNMFGGVPSPCVQSTYGIPDMLQECLRALLLEGGKPSGVAQDAYDALSTAYQAFLDRKAKGDLGKRCALLRTAREAYTKCGSVDTTFLSEFVPAAVGALLGHLFKGRIPCTIGEGFNAEDEALLRRTWAEGEEEHHAAALVTTFASLLAGTRYSDGEGYAAHSYAAYPTAYLYDVEGGVPRCVQRFGLLEVRDALAEVLGAESNALNYDSFTRGFVPFFAMAAALTGKAITVTWPLVVASKAPNRAGGIVVASSVRPNPLRFGKDAAPVTTAIAYGIEEETGESRLFGMADAVAGAGRVLGNPTAPGALAAFLAQRTHAEVPPGETRVPDEFQWAAPIFACRSPLDSVREKVRKTLFPAEGETT